MTKRVGGKGRKHDHGLRPAEPLGDDALAKAAGGIFRRWLPLPPPPPSPPSPLPIPYPIFG